MSIPRCLVEFLAGVLDVHRRADMCGIVAYLGNAQAKDIMLGGLARLEYRGYDSAGIALLQPSTSEADTVATEHEVKRRRSSSASSGYRLKIVKTAGKVKNLTAACEFGTTGTLGIAHTRWATHGPPNDINAHPHPSFDGKLCVVHNGIVENFKALRAELERKGYTMVSDTDTEVPLGLNSCRLCPACLARSVVLF